MMSDSLVFLVNINIYIKGGGWNFESYVRGSRDFLRKSFI